MSILMCPPRHYAVSYEINSWMHLDVPVDATRAVAQWEALYRTYVKLGEHVELVEPVHSLPDMVFTANAGVIWNGAAVPARFWHSERRGEERYWEDAFERLGFRTFRLPAGVRFEGAGDALFVGDRLFCGFGFRTDRQAHAQVGELLGVEWTSLELVDPRFYHLDTCFCPLDDSTVLFLPEAFTPHSVSLIRELVPTPIEVPLEAALGFACNGIRVGDHLVSSPAIGRLRSSLSVAGLHTIELPVSEFMKAGGGVRCLSLRLDQGVASWTRRAFAARAA
ncbi:MAG TPA: arginine deiminase-related protein [Candidatus Sulfotelmatobacter sp.]|nr:arginine deiminase-related protein [Candidatus Sulfotelmatobacter sp.]